jgi:hypothetical protein
MFSQQMSSTPAFATDSNVTSQTIATPHPVTSTSSTPSASSMDHAKIDKLWKSEFVMRSLYYRDSMKKDDDLNALVAVRTMTLKELKPVISSLIDDLLKQPPSRISLIELVMFLAEHGLDVGKRLYVLEAS